MCSYCKWQAPMQLMAYISNLCLWHCSYIAYTLLRFCWHSIRDVVTNEHLVEVLHVVLCAVVHRLCFFYKQTNNIQFNSHLSHSLVFKNQVGHQDHTSYYGNYCHYNDHHCPYHNTSVVTLRTEGSLLSSSYYRHEQNMVSIYIRYVYVVTHSVQYKLCLSLH